MGDAKRQNITGRLDGYAAEVGAALWRFEEARSRTDELLDVIPDGLVDAETDGNRLGTILYHLALIEADWLYTEILEEEPPEDMRALLPWDDREEGILTEVIGVPLAEHRARLATIRSTFLARMKSIDVDEFHRVRDLPDYEVTPDWVIHHLIQHEAEHRAEIGAIVARARQRRNAGT